MFRHRFKIILEIDAMTRGHKIGYSFDLHALCFVDRNIKEAWSVRLPLYNFAFYRYIYLFQNRFNTGVYFFNPFLSEEINSNKNSGYYEKELDRCTQ